MTVERRLASLEASLTPTQLVVRWLDEADAFGSLEAYVSALLDEPPERFPLNRLLGEAVAGVRSAAERRRGEEFDGAIRKALRDTAFRFELVMRINTTTHELVEREVLLHAALGAHLALLTTAERTTGRSDEAYLRRLGGCLDLAGRRVTELLASQEARSVVEARYLAGHLFPDGVAAFAEQLEQTQQLAVLAMRLAELDGIARGDPGNPDAVASRVSAVVEDLVEPARSTALEKLDENRRALEIATGWLRRKTERAHAAASETPTR